MTIHVAEPVALPLSSGRAAARPTPRAALPSNALIAGGGLTLAALALRPHFSGSDVDVYVQIAFSTTLVMTDLLLVVGSLLLTSSLLSLASVSWRASTVAILRALLALGCVLAIAQASVEVFALRGATLTLVHTASTNGILDLPISRSSEAFRAASRISGFAVTLGQAETLVLWGIAPVLTQLSLRRIPGYPKPLIAAAVLSGALCIGTGGLGILAGDATILPILGLVGPMLTAGCLVITGLWLAAAGRTGGGGER